ncbi:DUF7507 domain-containing protein [Pinibacter soli]|uniref:Gliding motility-associated C-terminal domain-containing protein n=1 Tax=Pinibacter soli TaxID=3044211 RepID=A0ABT6RFW5_9BACT|nr:gliding motility-associated C-terminal domain-containing protein [Pinibacter soli]MDI3321454.1 gliding motility-associated C-terminal domain-containing protein [Pinibacter soli]
MNVIFDGGQYLVKKIWLPILILLLACTTTIVRAQQDPPSGFESFDCSQNGYIVGNNSLYSINIKTGASQLIAALPNSPAGPAKTSYNSMGYYSGDNSLWATTGYGYLAKIDRNGNVQFFNVTGLPNTVNAGTSGHETSANAAFICGSSDMNGNLYLYNANAKYYYIVNVSSSTPVYTGRLQLGNGNGYNIADWVFDNNTNTLTGVDVGDSPIKKYVFNAVTGALAGTPITINPGTSGLSAENSSGSIFTDVSGTTYLYGNTTGGFYRINNSAPYTVSKITNLSVFQNNDGTNCPCISLGNLGFANSLKDITFCSGTPIAIDMFVFGTGTQDVLRIFKDGSLYKDNVIGTADTTIVKGLSEPGVYTASVWGGGCNGWVAINDTLTIRTKSCIPVQGTESFITWKSVSDASGDGKAQAGENLTYTINVKNTGAVQLNNIAVSDVVPANTSYVSGGDSYNSGNNTVSFSGMNLATGATASYSFVVKVANDLTGISKVSNQATVLVDTIPSTPTKPADPSNPNNPDPSCTNAAGCTTDIPVQGVESFITWKSVSDASGDGKAQAGENLTYTINVKNTGDVQLDNISVSDMVPAHTSYVSASGGTYNSGTNTVSFNGNSLAIGATRSFTFVVKVTNDLTDISKVSNQATVLVDDLPSTPTKPADPANPGNPDPSCTSIAGCTTDIPVQGVESFITWKSVSDASSDGKAQAGEELTYIINVKNTGNVHLGNIAVSDVVPAHTSYVSGGSYNSDNNTVSFNGNNLPTGATTSYSFIVKVTSDLTGISKVSNQATVLVDDLPSTPTKPADPANPGNPDPSCTSIAGCTTDIPVQGVESFITWKSVSDASSDGKAQAGENLTYTINVKNTGNVQLGNIAVSDVVPAHTSYVSGGSYSSDNNTVSFNGNNLPTGATTSFTFVVKVTNDLTGISKVSNQATVLVDDLPSTPTKPADPNNPDNPDPSCTDAAGCTTDIPVQGVESFITWKSVSDASGDGKAQAGEELTYTINVKNTGNVQLGNIVVSDMVPAHTSYVRGGSYNSDNNTVSFNGNNLPTGAATSFTFVVKVTNDLTGISKVSNQASVLVDDLPSTPTKPADPNNPGNPDPSCTDAAGCTTDIPVQGIESFITWKSVSDVSGDGKAQAGENLVYTIRVKNTGTLQLSNISVRDIVPAHTVYVSGGIYNSDNNTVSFHGSSLAIGATATYRFFVKVASDLTGISKISNQATVLVDDLPSTPTKSADPNNPGNPDPSCTDAAGCTTDIPVQGVESFITWKSVSDASSDGKAQAGENLTYTINVKNTGDVQLGNIAVSDMVPAHTSYVSGGTYNSDNNTVSFNGNNLATGATTSYSFVVKVTNDLTGISKVSNQATVLVDDLPSTPTKSADPNNPGNPDPSCTDAAGCTTDIPVQGVESFITWKSVSDASSDGKAQAGENLTYTINVKNTGNVQLGNIAVSDMVPAHTSYVSGGIYNSGTNTVSFNGNNLATGATASYSFVVKVTGDLTGISKVSNQATVLVDDLPLTPTKPADPANPNNPDPSCTDLAGCTTDIPVQGIESFITWKSVSDASGDGKAQAGEELTYTINVKNTGNVQLGNIVVSDMVPAHTSYVRGGIYNSDNNTVSFNGNDLPTGATTSFTFVVKVTNDLTGISKVSNQASVLVDDLPSTPTKPADPNNPGNPDPSCTDATGCTTDIPTLGKFHIPNVITPNGDGYNDKFVIQGTEGYDQVQVTIFNRWNNVVYQNSMYQNNWDGNGLNAGTYFYVIRALNKTSQQWEVYKGWVMIMR